MSHEEKGEERPFADGGEGFAGFWLGGEAGYSRRKFARRMGGRGDGSAADLEPATLDAAARDGGDGEGDGDKTVSSSGNAPIDNSI